MKVKIPTTIEDITLDQYQRYYLLTQNDEVSDYVKNKKIIQIFTNLTYQEVNNISQVDFEYLLNAINSALNLGAEYTPTFFIKNIEFGFIPNLDKITTAEFFNIEEYSPDKIENLHKLMAVLFRPIKNKDGLGNYAIHSYEGIEAYSDVMKQMPLSVVNGSLVFFSSLSSELLEHIRKFTNQVLARDQEQVITLKSGVGIQLLRFWQRVRYGSLKAY